MVKARSSCVGFGMVKLVDQRLSLPEEQVKRPTRNRQEVPMDVFRIFFQAYCPKPKGLFLDCCSNERLKMMSRGGKKPGH